MKEDGPATRGKRKQDRGPYSRAVGWPSDGDMVKRLRSLLDAILWKQNWYVGAGIVGNGKTAKEVMSVYSNDPEQMTEIALAFNIKPPVAKAPSKRVKRVARPTKRKVSHGSNSWVYEVPAAQELDDNDNIVFPLKVNDKLTIVSLGEIVPLSGYCSPKYLFPVGFKSERMHFSSLDHTKRVKYTSEIVKGQTKAVFRVTASDTGEVFEGKSASNVWNQVVSKVNETKSKVTGKRSNTTASGPEFVGYANKYVHKLLQELPGAAECPRYVMKDFVKLSEIPASEIAELQMDDGVKTRAGRIEQDQLEDLIATTKRVKEGADDPMDVHPAGAPVVAPPVAVFMPPPPPPATLGPVVEMRSVPVEVAAPQTEHQQQQQQ